MLSPIFNYFCAFTAFILLPNIFFQRFIKFQRGFSNAGAGTGYTFYPHSFMTTHDSDEGLRSSCRFNINFSLLSQITLKFLLNLNKK